MSILSSFSGDTDTHSLSVKIGAPDKYWEEVKRRYTVGDRVEIANIWEDCSPEERKSILLQYHEHDHVVLMYSSIFGLLIWRCDQVLIIGTRWLLSKINQAGVVSLKPGHSLLKWYKGEGRNLLAEAAINGAFTDLPNIEPNLKRKIVLDKLDDLCEELQVIAKFKDILSGKRINHEITISEFIELANKAYKYLSERSDLDVKIKFDSLLPKTKNLFPKEWPESFNGRNIIETMARFREGDMLKLMGAPDEYIEIWEREAFREEYGPVYRLLKKVGLSSIPGRNLCSLALNSEIDPSCFSKDPKTIFIEDILPWFRLSKIIDTYKTYSMPAETLRVSSVLSMVSNLAGFSDDLSFPFANSLKNKIIGSKANWTPVHNLGYHRIGDRDFSINDDQEIYFQLYSELPRKEKIDNYILIFENIVSNIKSNADRQSVDVFLMTEFSESIYFRPIPESDGVAKQLMYWWSRMNDEYLIIGILNGTPVRDPEVVGSIVLEGLKNYFKIYGKALSNETIDMNQKLFSKIFLRNSPLSPLGMAGVNSLIFYQPLPLI